MKPPFLAITWRSVNDEATISRPHALAALALQGQPFGFTQEDVKWLRGYAEFRIGDDFLLDTERDHLTDLAARIEALLPPEEPK